MGAVHPLLAVGVPQLNTDNWRIFPDGRMETTWKLRPSLTWRDGAGLTAEDVVFAWRVYAARGLGIFNPQPQDRIHEALAPDPQTIVFRWSSPYPDASPMSSDEFPPLPRHLLMPAFAAYEQDPGTRDAFVNHRYWTSDYVGAGAFRLDRLEPGAPLLGKKKAVVVTRVGLPCQ